MIQEGSDSGISLKSKCWPSRIKIPLGSSGSSLSRAWKCKGPASSGGIEKFIEVGCAKGAERSFSSSGDCSKESVHFFLFSAFVEPEQLLPLCWVEELWIQTCLWLHDCGFGQPVRLKFQGHFLTRDYPRDFRFGEGTVPRRHKNTAHWGHLNCCPIQNYPALSWHGNLDQMQGWPWFEKECLL